MTYGCSCLAVPYNCTAYGLSDTCLHTLCLVDVDAFVLWVPTPPLTFVMHASCCQSVRGEDEAPDATWDPDNLQQRDGRMGVLWQMWCELQEEERQEWTLRAIGEGGLETLLPEGYCFGCGWVVQLIMDCIRLCHTVAL